METYGHDFAQLKRAFVDFAAAAAVLRRRGAVHRRLRTCARSCRRSRSRSSPTASPRMRSSAPIDVANVGGRMRFVARRARQRPICRSSSNLAGVHNVQNALAAIAVGREVGVARRGDRARRSPSSAAWAAASSATARSRLGGGGTFTLIDDYGHHPAEMAATIDAARGELSRPARSCSRSSRIATRARATCSRTSCSVLSTVDALVLTEVYPGRRAADRRGRRPRARARGARRRQGRAGVRRERRRASPTRCARSRATATSWSRWAPARSARCRAAARRRGSA